MNIKKKILVVAPDFIYPANHGGRVDILNRILALVKLGYTVDLLYTSYIKADEIDEEYLKQRGIRAVIWSKRVKNIFSWFQLKSFQYGSRNKLSKVSLVNSYDFIILEADFVGSVLKNQRISSNRIFLRMHNDEVKYLNNQVYLVNNVAKKIFYKVESLLVRWQRSKIYNSVSEILCISFDEYIQFSRKYKNCCFLPSHIENQNMITVVDYCNRENIVLFVGNLVNPYNIDAIKWYLENVHKKISSEVSSYRLIIAGSTFSSDISWLEKLIDESITFIDSPLNLSEIYKKSAVFINPMRNGAGVKLKTLEAFANAIPVVSTVVGVEGIPACADKHFLLAQTDGDFVLSIVKLLQNRQFGFELLSNAQKFIDETYNESLLIKILD